jgi:hypothetical protein
MSTTLPAGGRNVIIVSFVRNAATYTAAQGTFRIYKGVTLLYETPLTQLFNYGSERANHALLIAVDTNPAGNDTYYFKINITMTGTATVSVHVQGIVIKADDAVWGYNTTAVSIAAGATATVTSISTSFPANSKVAIVAVAYGSHTTVAPYFIGAGNVKLKSGETVVSSNQFDTGSYESSEPFWVSLVYLDTPASGSQVYSVEVTNGSSVAFNCYAEIVAFTVYDGAFLDTGSVALTSGSQVTVGSLSTTLSGDVVVIGLAAAENTGTTRVTAFNAGDVVLQKDNSSTGQISNLVGWILEQTSYHGRSGIMPLFRLDTDVSNPSYQIKMTARATSINGEAKILVFTLTVVISVGDSGSGVELVEVNVTTVVSDVGVGVEAVGMSREMLDAGAGVEAVLVSPVQSDSGAGVEAVEVYVPAADSGGGVDETLVSVPAVDSSVSVEAVNMAREALDSGSGFDYFTGGLQKYIDDAGAGVEYVDMAKESADYGVGVEAVNMASEVADAGSGIETIISPQFNALADSGAGADATLLWVPQADSGAGVDVVNMARETADSGLGVDIVEMAREVADFGAGVEAVYVSATVISQDFASGVDVVGVTGYVAVGDAGVGVDVFEWFLSMYGMVLIDTEDVGYHSIPYRDWRQKNIPIQVHRRSVGDKVYVDEVEIGDVVVEWDDRVSDVVPGERVVIVTGVVELYD